MKNTKIRYLRAIVIALIVTLASLGHTGCRLFVELMPVPSEPSQVDISPLYQLKDFPMPSLKELREKLEKIKYEEGVICFESKDSYYDNGWTLHYDYNSPHENYGFIWYFEDAKERTLAWDYLKFLEKGEARKSRKIKISDEIYVLLFDSRADRDFSSYDSYGYSDDMHLTTTIRIGNIIFSFSENYDRRETPKNGIPTSKNIAMICNLLKE